MHGIHKQQPSSTFIRFGYNRLNVCNPFFLFLRIGLAWNRLKFSITHISIAHEHSCPCEAEGMAADFTDDNDGFFCVSRYSFT